MEKRKNKIAELAVNIIFGISIISLFLAFNFSDKMNGWYQQFLPNIGNHSISDIFFLDSLNGWAVTPYSHENDTAFVLKTTNGGDNWSIAHTRINQWVGYNKIKFLNINTGFVCGVPQFNVSYSGLNKSTDGGNSWVSLNVPDIYPLDMSILNEDTIWLVSSESLTGGVFRTTNGGLNWTQQFSGGTENPNEIYMYNSRIGFISGNPSPRKIRKTTDGGNSWFIIATNDYFADMYFADSLIGWKCSVFGMKKTTDGGLNWITQQIPDGGNIIVTGVKSFSNINNDTIWGTGGTYLFPNNQIRGILYRTTNGGNNWYYQIPDTTIHSGGYTFINFVNKNNGWGNTIIHTVTGGDTSFLTSTHQISSEVPNDYKLFQNFPNPFNPITSIKYQVLRNSNVKLIIYNMTGQGITTLVNEKKSTGAYEVTFDGSDLSSGIYFYTLFIDGNVIDTKKAVLVK